MGIYVRWNGGIRKVSDVRIWANGLKWNIADKDVILGEYDSKEECIRIMNDMWESENYMYVGQKYSMPESQ